MNDDQVAVKPTREDCLAEAAQAYVDGIEAQAARSPRDAAVAAGCRSEGEIDAWVARFRPDARPTASRRSA